MNNTFGPYTNSSVNNSSINDNDFYEERSYNYTFLIAFFPLFGVGLLIVIMFIFKCMYIPIIDGSKTIKYKYRNWIESYNLPIVNNKLSKKYIKTLKNNNCNKEQLECSICLEKIKNQSLILDCSHSYHIYCLQEWVKSQTSIGNIPRCPMCRESIIRQVDIDKITFNETVVNFDYESDDSNRTTLSDI